jgi:hypothetical protein
MTRGQSGARSRAQLNGQALVAGLALVAIGALGLMWQARLGRLVEDRIHLTDVADAAVWSAAQEQTRLLNLSANIQRAQVAHQLALAHLVTLASWDRFGTTESQQLATQNPPLSLIASFFGPAHGSAYAAARRYTGLGRDQIAAHISQHQHTIHQVLDRALAHQLAGIAAQRYERLNQVLQAQPARPPWRADATPIHDDWPQRGARRVAAGSGSTLLPLLAQAFDTQGILQPRNHQAHSLLPVSHRCPWLRHVLRRQGSTQLSPQGWWSAIDTQSWHALRSNRWIGCYYREYPMGFGAVRATGAAVDPDLQWVEEPPDNFSETDFWRWAAAQAGWDLQTGTQNPLANSRAMADAWEPAQRGLPGGAQLQGSPGLEHSIRLAWVLARQPASGTGSGLFRLPPVQYQIAAAESYFRPPPGEPLVNAHLFFPYWHTRLSAPRDAEREQVKARVSSAGAGS